MEDTIKIILGHYVRHESNEALKHESYYAEDQSRINRCLSCTSEECTNCIGGRPSRINYETVEMMVRAHNNAKTISEKLGVSKRTVERAIKRLGGIAYETD